jgi:hypothetical protein
MSNMVLLRSSAATLKVRLGSFGDQRKKFAIR